jgi:RNA polymerase sigma-70 factor (ECF subfamily)
VEDVSELARLAAGGDSDALSEFVRATITDVRRYCGALVDHASADDLTQETYLKAIRALGSYRGTAPAGAWLLGIARHTCIDEIRRRARRRDTASVALVVEPQHYDDLAGQLTIAEAISELADERREAFVLTQVIGMSYAEAARTVGCPIGTLRSRVFRARADLVDALREQTAPSSQARS